MRKIRYSDLRNSKKVRLIKPLFLETAVDKSKAFYTLREEDALYKGVVYPSAYKIYMSCADEYAAAVKIVLSISHWKFMCNSRWFMDGMADRHIFDGVLSWREDLKMKYESLAKEVLIGLTKEKNVTAAKQLYVDKPMVKKEAVKPKRNSAIANFANITKLNVNNRKG